jgi:hypothetical protein
MKMNEKKLEKKIENKKKKKKLPIGISDYRPHAGSQTSDR